MDWVKQLNIAIRYIEDHLTGTIEYDELAKMLCCSTYQFQRMFAFMNNVPLSEYIRRRKLSLAVADIQKGERVIDVALKYGYSSPTAFSRAFQCLHGITPSEARKKGTLLKTYPPISFKLTSQRKQSSNLDCQRCHKGIRNCRESKRTETLNYF